MNRDRYSINIIVALLFVFTQPLIAEEAEHFIAPVTANLHEAPNNQSKITAALRIGTKVKVLKWEGDWYHVQTKGKDIKGWIIDKYLVNHQPTFTEMWKKYKDAVNYNLDGKQDWLERALAIRPNNIAALSALADIYDSELHDHKNASILRIKIDNLTNPIAYSENVDEQVIFLLEKNKIIPLAVEIAHELRSVYESQLALDRFIYRYYKPEREFLLWSAEERVGSAKLVRGYGVGEIDLGGCHEHAAAVVKTTFTNTPLDEEVVIATVKPLDRKSKLDVGYKLNDSDQNEIGKKALEIYFNRMGTALSRIERELFPSRSKFKFDRIILRKRGVDERVFVQVRVIRPFLDDKNVYTGDTNTPMILAAIKKPDGNFDIVHSIVFGLKPFGSYNKLSLLGVADLNRDGIEELIIYAQGSEWNHIVVEVSNGASYEHSGFGSLSGC